MCPFCFGSAYLNVKAIMFMFVQTVIANFTTYLTTRSASFAKLPVYHISIKLILFVNFKLIIFKFKFHI